MNHYQDYKIYPPFYPDLMFTRAKGIYLYNEINNKKYIDLSASAGMAIAGYGNDGIISVIRQQLDGLVLSPQKYRTKEAEGLVRKILSLFPEDYDTVMPAVTGSEAVEVVLKAAAAHTGKDHFMSFANAYHGHTAAAGSLGEGSAELDIARQNFKTVVPPVKLTDNKRVLESIKKEFMARKYAAFIAEGVITNAGYRIVPPGFFSELSRLCQQYGVLLIFDEVLTGMGRTGKMFSFEHHGIRPDLVCLAKGLGSGYAAIAAVVVKRSVALKLDYFATFAWTPLACAVATANIDVIVGENLVENSRRLGEYALSLLDRYLGKCPAIRDVRGIGLGIAIEFNTREDALAVHKKCLDAGIILFRNIHLKTLFIQPPLVIKKNELTGAIKKIVAVVADSYRK